MGTIDATLRVCRDGSYWIEPHWLEPCGLEDPDPKYRTVDIKDGTGQIPPMITMVVPDRPLNE